jgi:hypothetical protein
MILYIFYELINAANKANKIAKTPKRAVNIQPVHFATVGLLTNCN